MLFEALKKSLQGDLYTDKTTRILYATDASAYREIPIAVTRPKTKEEIKKIIDYAGKEKISIIPRAAGTSLAGQVVGSGIVVDISKYLTNILELNKEEKWVRIQPGVILDELNKYLEPYGLFFGPETASSNRCMLGGMLGNNSCGAHSIIYGSTRDHTISVNAILSDGSEVTFEPLTTKEFEEKCNGSSLENKIYSNIKDILSEHENQNEIRKEFPHKSIKRRNTGYAIDLLLETDPFTGNGEKFNFCKLIAGSEGTLAFITEIKLNLISLPPKEKAVICIHFNSVNEALQANLIALKYKPGAVELIDNIVIDCTKDNIEQQKNRFFIKGNPGAILIIEFAKETKKEITQIAQALEKDVRNAGFGYHFPVIYEPALNKVWNLRKAGLGLLSNIQGDLKCVTVVEDTAVNVEVLPEYIEEFKQILKKYGLNCAYNAHAGSGQLHLRPLLNLKKKKDVELFHTIALETAKLVKKYRGSFSGEHGDGRLRGEFIPIIIGKKNYNLLKKIKATWDPHNIFNKGKIVDTPPMTSFLRYKTDEKTQEIRTIFDFSKTQGILRAAEKCNGSGDCRKTEIIGGTMCPSYMATRDEHTSTRARANILREFLTNSTKKNPFAHKEIYEIMELCLSCKACKSECPSSVDITKLKAEFLQHYYNTNRIPLRTKLIAGIFKINKFGSILPTVNNFFLKNSFTSGIIKKIFGFAPKRNIPLLYKTTLRRWAKKNLANINPNPTKNQKIYLFIDEFTNYNDTEIGIKAIKLLTKLGYYVELPKHTVSGRTYLSKGLLKKAQKIANTNVKLFKELITENSPLIGIEPSAILTFRDEYPELVNNELKDAAHKLAQSTFIIDEFIAKEIDEGKITRELFTKEKRTIKLHGHCHQKSLASTDPTKKILSLPENYTVEEIPSGCCGMAGSFGYEKEHYELSMQIGELVLFPEIRKTSQETIIAAPGTSCREQIKHGTQREALHPIEILYEALISRQ